MFVKSHWKFLLLGGTKHQGQAYQEAAALRGWELSYFKSMDELGYLGRVREFDAAIVHHDLHPLTGLELAEYLEKLFQSLPMVLLTNQDDESNLGFDTLPASVVGCLAAGDEPDGVLTRVEEAMQNRMSQDRSSIA